MLLLYFKKKKKNHFVELFPKDSYENMFKHVPVETVPQPHVLFPNNYEKSTFYRSASKHGHIKFAFHVERLFSAGRQLYQDEVLLLPRTKTVRRRCFKNVTNILYKSNCPFDSFDGRSINKNTTLINRLTFDPTGSPKATDFTPVRIRTVGSR